MSLSKVGKVLIEEIIARKLEEKKAEKSLYRWSYTAIASAMIFGGYILYYLHPNERFLHAMTTDIFMMILFGILAVSLLQVKISKDKLAKAEEEYDLLREEMIERAEEIWNSDELWKFRDEVYEKLKETYDVNLYHK